jgi:hypothetical protein
MGCQHEVFVRALREKKKVKLTFFSREQGCNAEKVCGPIVYSRPLARDDSDSYYFWDFDSGESEHLLCLSAPQIVSMELAEEPFDVLEFFTSEGEIDDSRCESDWEIP